MMEATHQETNRTPFSKKNTSHREDNVNQQDSVLSTESITKDERLYTTVNPVMLQCASLGVLKTTIQRK